MFEFDTAASTARSFATDFTVSQISGYVSQFVGHAAPSFYRMALGVRDQCNDVLKPLVDGPDLSSIENLVSEILIFQIPRI